MKTLIGTILVILQRCIAIAANIKTYLDYILHILQLVLKNGSDDSGVYLSPIILFRLVQTF